MDGGVEVIDVFAEGLDVVEGRMVWVIVVFMVVVAWEGCCEGEGDG